MLLEDLTIENGSSIRCLCCGDPLSSDVHVCPDCGAPSHGDCWDYIGGCGVMGCSARGNNLDSKVLGQVDSFGKGDKDSWINLYLDKVRVSLNGVSFIQSSDQVHPNAAIKFFEEKDAILASAEECAFFSILNNLQDRGCLTYTRTFCFGFKDQIRLGAPCVAYEEVSHKD
ncbi:MAG: RING finger protein [Nanoarchaeota archaeon]